MSLVINWEIVTINLTNIIINESNECAEQIGCSAGHEIKISDSRKTLSALFHTKDFRTSSESVYCFQTLCNYELEQQLRQFEKYRPIHLIFFMYVCFATSEILNVCVCVCVCVCVRARAHIYMELSNKYCLFGLWCLTVRKSSLTWIITRDWCNLLLWSFAFILQVANSLLHNSSRNLKKVQVWFLDTPRNLFRCSRELIRSI
jgi:hypothetical protein